MTGAWLSTYGVDAAALLVYVGAFAAFRALQRGRARRDPDATLQSQQEAVRARWVEEVLGSSNGILGVQALRNAIMGPVYFASNTMFLVMGTLSLSAQQHLAEAWRLLDPGGQQSPPVVAQMKLVVLLLTLLVAFFCFINAIRLFEHASISIGSTGSSPARATELINTAWRYQGLGVRCYYFAAPVLFWLFGAVWLVLAGAGCIALMRLFDDAPGGG